MLLFSASLKQKKTTLGTLNHLKKKKGSTFYNKYHIIACSPINYIARRRDREPSKRAKQGQQQQKRKEEKKKREEREDPTNANTDPAVRFSLLSLSPTTPPPPFLPPPLIIGELWATYLPTLALIWHHVNLNINLNLFLFHFISHV